MIHPGFSLLFFLVDPDEDLEEEDSEQYAAEIFDKSGNDRVSISSQVLLGVLVALILNIVYH